MRIDDRLMIGYRSKKKHTAVGHWILTKSENTGRWTKVQRTNRKKNKKIRIEVWKSKQWHKKKQSVTVQLKIQNIQKVLWNSERPWFDPAGRQKSYFGHQVFFLILDNNKLKLYIAKGIKSESEIKSEKRENSVKKEVKRKNDWCWKKRAKRKSETNGK